MATGKLKPGEVPVKLKIKKGDLVKVISGKDKGKEGKVLRAFPKVNKVLVEGVNIVIKHQRSRQTGAPGRQRQVEDGGRIEKPAPLFVPKVMLICPKCNKPTRVGYDYSQGEGKLASRKFRVCSRQECGQPID